MYTQNRKDTIAALESLKAALDAVSAAAADVLSYSDGLGGSEAKIIRDAAEKAQLDFDSLADAIGSHIAEEQRAESRRS